MKAGRDDGNTVLGRYEVVRRLARGGMGVVHLARIVGAAGFTRPVVVKRVLGHMADNPESLEAFAREARILAQLHHPNIVNVVDFGEEDSEYVMVLEYVRGYHLGQWHSYIIHQERLLSIETAVWIIGRILDALAYAHTFKQPDGTPTPIFHRDVSPSNVLLDTQGHVKLLDFGIARIQGAGEQRTRDGTFKGKLPFSAPELFHGDEPSARTDLYSCGVLLYTLLSNVNPFRGKTREDTLARVMTHTPPPVSTLRDDTTEGLDEVVARAMAHDPKDRFASAEEFASALRALQTRPSEELQRELASMLEADFLGEMPEILGIERLQDLDAAWREPGGEPQDPADLSDVTETVNAPAEQITTTRSQAPDKRKSSGAPPKSASPRVWIATGAVLAAIGATAIALALLSPTRGEPEPKVIVIEKESAGEQKTASGPSPASAAAPHRQVRRAASAAPAQATGQQPGATAAPRRAGATKPGNRAAELSRRFQSKQPQVQQCFASHAKDIAGSPRVTLRFEVTAGGSVDSAQLSPAALGNTALGACLLRVARSARFDPQPEPIAFSIPITARRVQ